MTGPSGQFLELQAELCKTLSSPRRLEIISALKDGEKRVTDLVAALGAPKANVSQHLAFMRHAGVVGMRKEGTSIYYSIADPRILKACTLLREVLAERMRRSGEALAGEEKFF